MGSVAMEIAVVVLLVMDCRLELMRGTGLDGDDRHELAWCGIGAAGLIR